MSEWRRAAKLAKRDDSEPGIIQALEKAGWHVWPDLPVDLLAWKEGHGFRVLEVKTPQGKKDPKARMRKRQVDQLVFLATTGAPVVCTPEQALAAVGESIT